MRSESTRALRFGIVSACVIAVIAAFPSSASASVSLAGEETNNNTEDWTTIFGANAASLCDGAGSSHLPFTLRGRATGPFPGTFTETGTATVGRRTTTLHWDVDVDAGPVLGFRSSFTITSGDTLIQGRTWLVARGGHHSIAGCGSFTDAPSVLSPGATFSGFEIVLNEISVRYRATVTSPTGSSAVSGQATASLLAEHYVTTHCALPPPLICSSESSGWGGGEIFS
jgi:hypothetical protein